MTVPATETTPTPTPTPTPAPTPTPTPTPTPAPTPAPTPGTPDPQLGDAGKQAIDRMKEEKKAAEKRAKDAETELERLRATQMTESERAVAEAKTQGRTEAVTEMGKQLARARFDALAARRNAEANTDDILEFVDLGRFVNEKGELDDAGITAAVAKLVPESTGRKPPPPPSYDGGAFQTGVTPATTEPGMGRLREAYRPQPTRA